MKKIFLALLIALPITSFAVWWNPLTWNKPTEVLEEKTGATVFRSSQVGTSPQNGYYLQSDGENSSWQPVIGGGGGGGGGAHSTSTAWGTTLYVRPNNASDIYTLGYDGSGVASSSNEAEYVADPIAKLAYYINGMKLGIGTTSPYAALSVVGETVGTYFTATGTRASTFPYSSSTIYSSFNISSSTSGLFGSLSVPALTSALVQTDANGLMAEYAGTSCTNQFVRSLSVLGAATCATVANTDLANSTISGVALGSNLADLTATDSSLTFSGAYNGGTARTVGLNVGNSNTWTVLQTFNYSSTTGQATFANASSTQWVGGGLQPCNATTGKLNWDATTKQFKCDTDQNTGGSGGADFPNVQVWGNATSTTLGFLNGFLSTASSTLATTTLFDNTKLNLATNQDWVYSGGHQSDLIRLSWLTNTSKPAITFYDATSSPSIYPNGQPGLAAAAIVAHDYLSFPDNRHQHISIETRDATTNNLNSRFECLWGFDSGADGGYCGVASGYNLRIGSGSDLNIIDGDINHNGVLNIYPNTNLGNSTIGLRVATSSVGDLVLSGNGATQVEIGDNLLVSGSTGISVTGTTIGIDSTGTATNRVDRGATTNFAQFTVTTAGTDQWSLGLRNDSTNDFHFRDNVNSRTPLKIVQSSGLVQLFNNASSTLFSSNWLKVGGTASTTLDGAGNVTYAGLLSGPYSSSTIYSSFLTASSTFANIGTLSMPSLANSFPYFNSSGTAVATTSPVFYERMFSNWASTTPNFNSTIYASGATSTLKIYLPRAINFTAIGGSIRTGTSLLCEIGNGTASTTRLLTTTAGQTSDSVTLAGEVTVACGSGSGNPDDANFTVLGTYSI